MAKQKAKNPDAGLTILMVCGVIAIALIVGCVCFPEALFGLFFK